jgi:hypothetical protein
MPDFFREAFFTVFWFLAFCGMLGVAMIVIWVVFLEIMGWRSESGTRKKGRADGDS